MTSKGFSILLLVTLVLGIGLGGAFAGGFALGKSRGPDPSQGSASLRPPSGFQASGSQREGGAGFAGRNRRSQGASNGVGRQDGADGPASSGDSLAGRGSGSQDPAAGRRLFGSITSFQGGVITLDSLQGQVQVAISEDAAIQKTVTRTRDDLVVGIEVRIQGRRTEDGQLQARSIMLGAENPGESEESSSPVGGGRRGFGGGVSLYGTIEVVEDGLVTVATSDGISKVAVSEGTGIQELEPGANADLVQGATIRIIGSPNNEGELQATLVILVPGGAGRLSGRGFRDGGRQPQ